MNRSIFYDGLDTTDCLNYSTFKTSIDIKNSETGEIIFKGLKNKVIIPGSGLIGRKLFDLAGYEGEITPTYNEKISGMINPVPGQDKCRIPTNNDINFVNTIATENNHKVLLFCCGVDGCGSQNSQVYPVDYRKWIDPNDLVPFRCVPKDNDISDELRESYFGRSNVTLNNNEYIAYYFKRFEEVPTIVQQFIDGTQITKASNIYDVTNTTAAETYVEMNLKITTQDLRDYFVATTGMDNARINSISLCTAYPVIKKEMSPEKKTEQDYIYFKDIRPLTKLNFPNEQFIDASKGIDIIYHIYM